MPEVFRPVRWWVLTQAGLAAVVVAVFALGWPDAPLLGRLAGLAVAGVFAVAVALPVAEQVEVGPGEVVVHRLARGRRAFAGPGTQWSVVQVQESRRWRRTFDVLTLQPAGEPPVDVLLKYYRATQQQRLLAAVAQALSPAVAPDAGPAGPAVP